MRTQQTFALNITSNYLDPLLQAGKDVIVYAYSSGGAKCGHAGPSLVKSAREARREKGGVVGIVYMSFATVPAGMSQLKFLGRSWPPFVHEDAVRFNLSHCAGILLSTDALPYHRSCGL